MAGSKSVRGRGASVSGKRNQSGKRLSTDSSRPSTSAQASPPSVSRKPLPPQYHHPPPEPQNSGGSQPQQTPEPNRRSSESPGSQTSLLRRPQKERRTSSQLTPPLPQQTPVQILQYEEDEPIAEDGGDEAEDDVEEDEEGGEDDAGQVGSDFQPQFDHHQIAQPQLPLESLLAMEGREMLTKLSPHPGEGMWFTRNEGVLVNTIAKIIQQKFDGPWYSWTGTPPHIHDRYFIQLVVRVFDD